MFRFNDPLVLLLLLTLPVIAWIRHRAEGRRTGAIRFSSVSAAREAAGITSGWAHRVPGILRAVALTALIVALARPQTGMTSEDVRTQGIDILLALDVSSSMLAEDLEPNRLSAAKSVAAEFVQGRGNDRIGLIAFAGKAVTQAPLTLDYGVVTELLGDLEIGMIEDGTAVGMGLATAVKRLQASSATSKVVILLTDGRSNRGEIGPVTAAQMAQALGVRVYTIGAGSQGTARMPVVDPLRGTSYANVQVDIDEVSLQEIAELTGGQYFRATDTESLAQIWAQIDELETTEIEVQNYTQYEERFGLVLMFGFLMLGLELGLSSTVLRRLP